MDYNSINEDPEEMTHRVFTLHTSKLQQQLQGVTNAIFSVC